MVTTGSPSFQQFGIFFKSGSRTCVARNVTKATLPMTKPTRTRKAIFQGFRLRLVGCVFLIDLLVLAFLHSFYSLPSDLVIHSFSVLTISSRTAPAIIW